MSQRLSPLFMGDMREVVYDRRVKRALGFVALAGTGYITSVQLAIEANHTPRLGLSFLVSVPLMGSILLATSLFYLMAEREFYTMLWMESECSLLLDDSVLDQVKAPLTVVAGGKVQNVARFVFRVKGWKGIVLRSVFDILVLLPLIFLWWFSGWALVHGGLLSSMWHWLGHL